MGLLLAQLVSAPFFFVSPYHLELRNDRDFVKYTIDKSMKKKEKHHLELYVNHLKRIQDVDRTFNFSLATITSALHTVNKET